MAAFGIMKKIKMNSIPDRVIPEPTEELKSLTIEPFLLVFIILIFGYIISTAVLMLEVFDIPTRVCST